MAASSTEDDFGQPTSLLGATAIAQLSLDDDDDFGAPTTLLGPSTSSAKNTWDDDDFGAPSTLLGASLASSTQDELPSISQVLPTASSLHGSLPAPFPGQSSRQSPHLVKGSNYAGKPVYFMKKYKAYKAPVVSGSSEQMRDLLDVPIHRLLDQVSQHTATKLSNEDSSTNAAARASSKRSDDRLWVDQYRPERFIDLLGDERVHREALGWVKEWDVCVFGKRKAGKGGSKASTKRSWDHDSASKATTSDTPEWINKDEWQRPREKILLLSGPPGLGKTTLAHVIAKQAGYRVYEINASDARSGQVIDERVRPALESGSRIGSTKPTLVVIDEIDGATGAGDSSATFVQKLVELTMDPKAKKKGRRKDGKPERERPLLRPIICICNDLYASSLAKLRPHARIVRFNRPADVTIVKRLRSICEEQSLRADSRALTTLVAVTRGDMRGCLNTLQFIKARHSEVTEDIVRGATAGIKEADSSATSVLNDLFNPVARKRAKDLGLSEEEERRYVHRLGREVEATGSMDKVAIGIFEHYTSRRKHDSSFKTWQKAQEWLVTFDELMGSMRSNVDYSLMTYLAYTMVPFYPLFQERGGPRVERPKADWENYLVTRTNEEIYSSLSKCLRAASAHRGGDFRHLAGHQILQLEFAPLINRIISPPLRPVNSQVIKTEEKNLLNRLVSIMVSLELRFVQDKTEEGQLVYRLDPPLDVFVTYDGKRAADIPVSRYATRHLVAAEIDAKLIVRHAEALEKHKQSKTPFAAMSDHEEEHGEHDMDADTEGTLMRADPSADQQPAKRQRTQPEIDVADKPPTDFFGRPITVAPAKSRGKGKKSTTVPSVERKPGVNFRFNEGNSAAVRRNVKVSSFL